LASPGRTNWVALRSASRAWDNVWPGESVLQPARSEPVLSGRTGQHLSCSAPRVPPDPVSALLSTNFRAVFTGKGPWAEPHRCAPGTWSPSWTDSQKELRHRIPRAYSLCRGGPEVPAAAKCLFGPTIISSMWRAPCERALQANFLSICAMVARVKHRCGIAARFCKLPNP